MSMRRTLSASVALALLLTMLMTLTASAQENTRTTANYRDANAVNDSLVVDFKGAVRLSSGTRYQGWLIDLDGNMITGDGLIFNRSSEFIGTYVSPDGVNLLEMYPTFAVTIEPNPDPNPDEADGNIAYGSSVPVSIGYWANRLTNENGAARSLYNSAMQALMNAEMAQDADDPGMYAQAIIDGLAGVADDVALVSSYADNAEASAGDDDDVKDAAAAVASAASETNTHATNLVSTASKVTGAANPSTYEVQNLMLNARKLVNGFSGSKGAADVLEMSQDLSVQRIAAGEPPAAGDATLPSLALGALIVGAVLAIVGGLLMFRGRQARSGAFA